MFNIKKTRQDLGDGLFRHKLIYYTVECEPFSMDGIVLQQSLLRSIVDSPELLFVGDGRFQQMTVKHDGMKWILELQRDAYQE